MNSGLGVINLNVIGYNATPVMCDNSLKQYARAYGYFGPFR